MTGVRACPVGLATTRYAAPLALLFAQIELACRQRSAIGVLGMMMGEIALVCVISGDLAKPTPERTQALGESGSWTCHCLHAAIRTAAASEDGSTGKPLRTRSATRSVSTITIHKIAVSISASAASRR